MAASARCRRRRPGDGGRRVTPVASRATCTGFIMAFGWMGHGLGGVIGGYLYDMTASYDLTFAVAALAGSAGPAPLRRAG